MVDVITIGSATRDAFFEGIQFDYHHKDQHLPTGKGVCLPLGSKLQVDKVTFTSGGAGTNAAVTFARQGLASAALARLGSDINGKEIARELEHEGIATSLLQYDSVLPTSYSVILMEKNAERTILAFSGAGGSINAKEVPWETMEAQWVYLDSLGGNEDILKNAVKLKQQKKIKLAWNPGTKDLALGLKTLKPYLASLDVCLANQEEIAALLGIPYKKEEEIFKAFDALVPGIAIMTKGPQGVIVSDGKERYQAGIFPEKALVDRTGAGDAFGSGFVVGLLRGGIEEGLRLGSANSTSVLEHIGAKEGILRKDDLQDKRWSNLAVKRLTL